MRKVFKILIVGLVLIGVVGVGFYLIFFSQTLANETRIMEWRYKYLLRVEQYDWLKSTIQVARLDEEDSSMYWYILDGQVEKVDFQKLYVRGRDGRLYTFVVNWRVEGDLVKHLGLKIKSYDENNDDWDWMEFDARGVADTKQWYGIVWRDNRKLSEIMREYRADPNEHVNITEWWIKYLIKYEK